MFTLANPRLWPLLSRLTISLSARSFNDYLFGSERGQRQLTTHVLYTAMNFALSMVVWAPVMLGVHLSACSPELRRYSGFISWQSFKRHWYVLVSLSLSITISTATQNASLASIPLTINQLLKALSVLPMLLLSYLIERKTYRLPILLALALQLAGALLAAVRSGADYSGHGDQMRGYIDVAISVLSAAIRPVLAGYLYSVDGGPEHTGFSPIALAFYDASFAMLTLLPVALVWDGPALQNLYALGRAGEAWSFTIVGSCMAVVYNLVVFVLVRQIASIGYQALAQFNTVVVVGGAALFVDHIHDASVWLGTILCLLASTAYVCLRFIDQPHAPDNDAAALTGDVEGQAPSGSKAAPNESTPLKEPPAADPGAAAPADEAQASACAVQ